MTKDAVAGRIRRLLAMADKRAADLGIPNTEAVPDPGHARQLTPPGVPGAGAEAVTRPYPGRCASVFSRRV